MINEVHKFLKIAIAQQNVNGQFDLLKDHVYFVGGCVRDFYRDKKAHDVDIVVDLPKGGGAYYLANVIYSTIYLNKSLDECESIITKPFELGHYPIYSITFKGNFELFGHVFNLKGVTIEIADSMNEYFPNDESRQRIVKFASIQEDVMRRDFSINSGLIDAFTFEFKNYSHEDILRDIENGVIQCNDRKSSYINKIFSDDPLRILRGCVFAARFNYKIDSDVKERMIENIDRLKIISRERINAEVKKAFDIQGGAFRLIKELDSINGLEYIFPGIEKLKKVYQYNQDENGNFYPDVRNIHLEGPRVFDHVLNVLRYTKKGYVNGLTALYHDVGKIYPEYKNGKIRFINHEFIGAKIIDAIFPDMKIDTETTKSVKFLVENHMKLHKLKDLSKRSLRRFIREIPTDELRYSLYEICNADCLGTVYKDENGITSSMSPHYEAIELVENLIQEDSIIVEKPFRYFNGNEIMGILDITGKAVGDAIKIMLDLQDKYGFKMDKNFIKEELIKEFKKKQNKI